MNYRVEPGLYAVGSPDRKSYVFISANYKLSFDHLRRALDEMNAWILVINTKGINVWCAAGKKTFGTNEIIQRITSHRLEQLVDHHRIILPQLGATGVAAHEVKTADRLFGHLRTGKGKGHQSLCLCRVKKLL